MNKIILVLSLISILLSSCTYYLGPNRWEHSFSEKQFLVPSLANKSTLSQEEQLELLGPALSSYADQNIHEWSQKFQDTILNTRVIFAKLLLQKDVDELNRAIQNAKAWGSTGTSSKLNKYGDYDFSEIQWVNILYYFQDAPEVLFPTTAKHIVDHLIIDNGAKPSLKAPNTLGLIRETENHILMKEGSRYLKNQWLYDQYGKEENNNAKNGLEKFLIAHLESMVKTGFFEFNANPYISYTLEAIHIIHSYSKNEEIKTLSANILNAEHWQYALGSFQLKKYSPFRRRMSRIEITSLFGDRHGIMIRAELAKVNETPIAHEDLPCCYDRLFTTITSDYQLPHHIKLMIEEKPNSYLAKIGHGIKSSPEIYYGTPNYLLSAGGLRFGKVSQIVPRPNSLILDDDAKDIQECFHTIHTSKPKQWNNTGLYKNLMVSKDQFHIPAQYDLHKSIGNWKIYKPYEQQEIYICIFNSTKVGVLYIGDENFEEVLQANLDEGSLQKSFYYSSQEKVKFHLNSRKKWIITHINDEKTVRKFKKWPRFDLSFE